MSAVALFCLTIGRVGTAGHIDNREVSIHAFGLLSALSRHHLSVSFKFLTRTSTVVLGKIASRTLPLSSRNEDSNMSAGWVVLALALHCYPFGRRTLTGPGHGGACGFQVPRFKLTFIKSNSCPGALESALRTYGDENVPSPRLKFIMLS